MVVEYSRLENLCCHELSPSSRRLFRKISPHRDPGRWLCINIAVLIWSIRLLIYIIGTRNENEEDDEKTYVEMEYLFYNFGTCAVWAIEVGLNIFDHIDTKEEGVDSSLLQQTDQSFTDTSETKPLWIELTLAIYFVVDSLSVVGHLNRKEIHKLSKGMLGDVVINMLAYLYLVYRQGVDWRNSNFGKNENEEESDLNRREVV